MKRKALIMVLLLFYSVVSAEEIKSKTKMSSTMSPPPASVTTSDIIPENEHRSNLPNQPEDGDVYDNNKTVIPEVAVFVELSNVDVNRVVCQGDVKDVIYSKEKGVNVKIIDNNIFIKFIIRKENGKETKSSKPTEFYIVCDKKVYNLIAMPKGIPSQTIRLGDNKITNIRKNSDMFKGLPFEKKVSKIMRIMVTNSIPESFTTEVINQKIDLYNKMEIIHLRKIKIEGEGIIVNEFSIKNNDGKTVELKETDFIDPVIADKMVAISITPPTLLPGKTSRLFTISVEKGDMQE